MHRSMRRVVATALTALATVVAVAACTSPTAPSGAYHSPVSHDGVTMGSGH